jgi:hypothetical protein
MVVLKWLLIVGGIVFLIGAAVIFGFLYWASTVESVHVTEADLAVGGSYPPEERQTLLDACTKRVKEKDKGACTCIADRAGTEFSRFERLILTATFEGSPTKIVAVTKGLIDSGVSQDKSQALEKESEKRFDDLMKACGLAQ